MAVPKGGRGKKAPYNTVVVRIPEDLEARVESMTEQYRKELIEGVKTNEGMTIKSLDEAKKLASQVISQKKNARISLAKLLQLLYDVGVNPKEL